MNDSFHDLAAKIIQFWLHCNAMFHYFVEEVKEFEAKSGRHGQEAGQGWTRLHQPVEETQAWVVASGDAGQHHVHHTPAELLFVAHERFDESVPVQMLAQSVGVGLLVGAEQGRQMRKRHLAPSFGSIHAIAAVLHFKPGFEQSIGPFDYWRVLLGERRLGAL